MRRMKQIEGKKTSVSKSKIPLKRVRERKRNEFSVLEPELDEATLSQNAPYLRKIFLRYPANGLKKKNNRYMRSWISLWLLSFFVAS